MNTLQLHLVTRPPAEPAQLDDTELELQVWWVLDDGPPPALYSGSLRVPALILRQLQQATPMLESILPDGIRICWTGVALEPLPPNKALAKLAKLLRGMRRLWSDG